MTPPTKTYPPVGPIPLDGLNWKQYEAYVAGTLERLNPTANVARNVKIRGVRTNRLRQIDILIECRVGADFHLRIAVECKAYKRKLNVKDVESFLGMLGDLRISKGIMMAERGYTGSAIRRIENESRDVEVKILRVSQLSPFQAFGPVGALLWKGTVGAFVKIPETWVIDNEQEAVSGAVDADNRPQFTAYPLGHTRDSAVRRSPFIYGIIVLKSPAFPTVEAIYTAHEQMLLSHFPAAVFDELPPVRSESGDTATLRVGKIDARYGGPEYRLYVDHPAGVLAIVLLCPEAEDELHLPTLRWIGQNVTTMDCICDGSGDPREGCS